MDQQQQYTSSDFLLKLRKSNTLKSAPAQKQIIHEEFTYEKIEALRQRLLMGKFKRFYNAFFDMNAKDYEVLWEEFERIKNNPAEFDEFLLKIKQRTKQQEIKESPPLNPQSHHIIQIDIKNKKYSHSRSPKRQRMKAVRFASSSKLKPLSLQNLKQSIDNDLQSIKTFLIAGQNFIKNPL